MNQKYLPHVDGLRAVAVIAVIVYHMNKSWLPGGYLGVDVFFVISGFVVSSSIADRTGMSLPSFLAFFYARRLRRIAPALLVMLLCTALLSALLIPMAWLSIANQQTGLYALIGMSNFILAANTGNYFSPTAEFNPFTHTWSLAVEEQFYLLFPMLLFVWLLAGRWRLVALIATALLVLASAVISAWLSISDPTDAFYMLWSRFWQLGAGALLFELLATAKRTSLPPGLAAAGGWVSAALLVGSLALGPMGLAAPFPGSLAAVAGALGLIGFLLLPQSRWSAHRVLSWRPTVFVGRISYSLYLWHWPIFVLFRWTVGLDLPVFMAAAFAATILASLLSYYLVEQPVRLTAPWVPRISVVAAGLLAICVGVQVMLFVNREGPKVSLSQVTRHAADWYPQGSTTDAAYPGCVVFSKSTPVGPTTRVSYWRAGCAEPTEKFPKLFVMGDSHSGHYDPIYKLYVLATGQPVEFYEVGCSYLNLFWSEVSADCLPKHQAAMEEMLRLVDADSVVFLSSLRMPKLTEQYATGSLKQAKAMVFSDGAKRGRAAAETDAAEKIGKLLATGARVLLPRPTPVFPSPPFRCAESYESTNSICAAGLTVSMAVLTELRTPVLASIDHLRAKLPRLETWDPLPILCPTADTCSAMRGDKPILFDGDHLSAYGNDLLWPSFFAAVTKTVPNEAGSPASAM